VANQKVISASVGKSGKNLRQDVETVQRLLKEKKEGYDPGPTDGFCGVRTIAAIALFQRKFLHHPDGLIKPGGTTWQRLVSTQRLIPPSPPVVSGYWTGAPERWSQDKKLESLNVDFRGNVKKLVAALEKRGFKPKIYYGWRSVAIQLELFKKKVSLVKFSFHNAQQVDGTPNSYAADIIDERWAWTAAAESNGFWKALGEEAKKLGLIWGGDWVEFRDWAHVQGRRNNELADVKRESGL